MTTSAQISAQIVDLMTRWNAQQDQLADWLTGNPAGGPNGDGKFPLTNAEGETRLFLSLPAVLDQITGPAAAAVAAKGAAEAAAVLAQAAKAAAEALLARTETDRATTSSLRADVAVQRADVAAKWSDVGVWHSSVSGAFDAVEFNSALIEGIYDEIAGHLVTAQEAAAAAVVAKNETTAFAASFNPAAYLPLSGGKMTGMLSLETSTGISMSLRGREGDDASQLRFFSFANELSSIIGNIGGELRFFTAGSVLRFRIGAAGNVQVEGNNLIVGGRNVLAAIDSKAAGFHTHSTLDVAGLRDALDAKLNAVNAFAAGRFQLDNGAGRITLDATSEEGRTGFIEWRTLDNIRVGYLGYATSSTIEFAQENGRTVNFTGGLPRIGGVGIATIADVQQAFSSLESRVAALEAA